MEHWSVCSPLLSEQIALHWALPSHYVLLRLQEEPFFRSLMAPEDRRLLICVVRLAAASKTGRRELPLS
jgi:hypothetical protein